MCRDVSKGCSCIALEDNAGTDAVFEFADFGDAGFAVGYQWRGTEEGVDYADVAVGEVG